ncbi:hypothetical protein, partial [Caminibacter sp.]
GIVYSSRGNEICRINTPLKNGIYEAELAHKYKRDRDGADKVIKALKRGESLPKDYKFYIFDIIDKREFKYRIKDIIGISDIKYFMLNKHPRELLKDFKDEEGLIIKSEHHVQNGKISSLAYKVKHIKTADLKIFKKENGYLFLKDKNNITAKCRVNNTVYKIAKINDMVEIKYDRIINKYDQVSFIRFRYDK